MSSLPEAITVRPASAEDLAGLTRLAALDSAALPGAPLVVAEVDGELRAALSLADGRAIADPFHPSLALVDLLRLHVATAAPAAAVSSRRGRRAAVALRFA
jgi:hypothetical protein